MAPTSVAVNNTIGSSQNVVSSSTAGDGPKFIHGMLYEVQDLHFIEGWPV